MNDGMYVWLCDDCLMAEENGSFEGLSSDRIDEIVSSLNNLRDEGHVSAAFNAEYDEGILAFGKAPCDCCKSPLFGGRHRYYLQFGNWTVAVTLVRTLYGGPEEGGWYYDMTTVSSKYCQHLRGFANAGEARAYRDKLVENELPAINRGRRELYGANGKSTYDVAIFRGLPYNSAPSKYE